MSVAFSNGGLLRLTTRLDMALAVMSMRKGETLRNTSYQNGSKQKVIPLPEVKNCVTQGWESVASLPDNSPIVRLPL